MRPFQGALQTEAVHQGGPRGRVVAAQLLSVCSLLRTEVKVHLSLAPGVSGPSLPAAEASAAGLPRKGPHSLCFHPGGGSGGADIGRPRSHLGKGPGHRERLPIAPSYSPVQRT